MRIFWYCVAVLYLRATKKLADGVMTPEQKKKRRLLTAIVNLGPFPSADEFACAIRQERFNAER